MSLLVKARSFYVATEYFCVATEFSQGKEFLCRNIVFLCHDRVWSRPGVSMSRQSIFV